NNETLTQLAEDDRAMALRLQREYNRDFIPSMRRRSHTKSHSRSGLSPRFRSIVPNSHVSTPVEVTESSDSDSIVYSDTDHLVWPSNMDPFVDSDYYAD